jgi:hypothetical protein
MRSESEIRWVRSRARVNQMTVISDWHAIVPGFDPKSSPGTSCDTPLAGSLQFELHSGVRTREGHIHEPCWQNAMAFVEGIDSSPGPQPYEEEPPRLAAPGTGDR